MNGWNTGAKEEGLLLAMNIIGALLMIGGWFAMILLWLLGVI